MIKYSEVEKRIIASMTRINFAHRYKTSDLQAETTEDQTE